MQGASVGDVGTGTCPNHDTPQAYITTFVTGASSVLINGRPAAIVGTLGAATCSHQTTALVGSASVFFEGRGAHRFGDTGVNFGPYSVASASSNVIIG